MAHPRKQSPSSQVLIAFETLKRSSTSLWRIGERGKGYDTLRKASVNGTACPQYNNFQLQKSPPVLLLGKLPSRPSTGLPLPLAIYSAEFTAFHGLSRATMFSFLEFLFSSESANLSSEMIFFYASLSRRCIDNRSCTIESSRCALCLPLISSRDLRLFRQPL